MRFVRVLLMSALLLVVVFKLGVAEVPDIVEVSHTNSIESDAGSWRSWVVDESDLPLLPRPPVGKKLKRELTELRSLMRVGKHEDFDIEWKDGASVRWNRLQRDLTRERIVSPPEAARGFALVSIAMCDAVIHSSHLKYRNSRPRPADPDLANADPRRVATPGYVPSKTAISAAAAEVLLYLFPSDRVRIHALLSTALQSDLHSGRFLRTDVEAGALLGTAIGTKVVLHAKGDGAQLASKKYAPSGLRGRWVCQRPGYGYQSSSGKGNHLRWVVTEGWDRASGTT